MFSYSCTPPNSKPTYKCLLPLCRYQDDIYDRIWMPYSLSGSIAINTTSDTNFQGSNDTYALPVEVLRTAAQPQSNLSSLSYYYNSSYLSYYFNSSSSSEFFVYFHFAEIVVIPQGLLREFIISLNGVNNGPITLQYLKPLTIMLYTKPIQGYINFSINSTLRSNLPPILNAFEILMLYPLSDLPTAQTDGKFYIWAVFWNPDSVFSGANNKLLLNSYRFL